MWNRKTALVALVVLAGGAASVGLACGPFFPWQLLDNRTATLRSTPKNSFAFEAMHLASQPKDGFKAVEFDYDPIGESDQRAEAFKNVEIQGLSPGLAPKVAQMRAATDDVQALVAGEGLPRAIQQYTAGAVAFHAGNVDLARQHFQAVLAMPQNEARPRAIWSAYSLAQIDVANGDSAGAESAFQSIRVMATHGVPDPFGFAVASFGDEARLHFDHANSLLVGSSKSAPPSATGNATANSSNDQSKPPDRELIFAGYTLPSGNVVVFGQEMSTAAALYSEQAAHQSNSGVQSLRILAQNILSDPQRLDATIADPRMQRLLVAYVLARVDDNVAPQQNDNYSAEGPDAGIRATPAVTANALLPTLIDAITRSSVVHAPGADRLAALSYRVGRYDLAAQMANMTETPLGDWVKAKIALQRGDLAGAAKFYAAASKAFPSAGSSLDTDNVARLTGENGTLALARGQYVDALDKLFPVASTYWGDVADIAERVLTVDELKDFVDRKTTAMSLKPAQCLGPDGSWGSSLNFAAELRDVLARRLMRAGRYDDAQPYFCNDKTRANAQAYAAALNEGDADWGSVDRAEAMFKAATLARMSGMEIMGAEEAPDYAYLAGDYDGGIGQTDLKGAYVTAGERSRFAANKTDPDTRYHYRFIAADEAMRAADLLPPRSQAFAAVLCQGSRWMFETPGGENRAYAIYRRYIKQGPHVAWGKAFGEKCPTPDFAGAIFLERVTPFRVARHFIGHHRWWFFGGFGAILLLLLGLAVLFRERIAGMFVALRSRS